MKLTKKKAKELAIKKWEYIVENDGSDSRLTLFVPEVYNMLWRCPYCELFATNVGQDDNEYCFECPIRPKIFNIYKQPGCWQSDHPFKKWIQNKTKENAQKVLDLIKKS